MRRSIHMGGRGQASMRPLALILLAGLLLGACSHKNAVTFVTTTSIGIDADAKTASANIGVGRQEVVIGPAYENGGIPPVYADLNSDLKLFAPEIRQLYATGDAARLISGYGCKYCNDERRKMNGERRRMIFGTATNIGLKLGFAANGAPEQLTLGYKRQEFSRIPLRRIDLPALQGANVAEDIYGSVLASIKLRVSSANITSAGLTLNTFFATGDAAEGLAKNPELQHQFAVQAQQSMGLVDAGTFGADQTTADIEDLILNDEACLAVFNDWAERHGVVGSTLLYTAEQSEHRVDALAHLRSNC